MNSEERVDYESQSVKPLFHPVLEMISKIEQLIINGL